MYIYKQGLNQVLLPEQSKLNSNKLDFEKKNWRISGKSRKRLEQRQYKKSDSIQSKIIPVLK